MVSRAWPDGGGMGQIATDYRQNQEENVGKSAKTGKIRNIWDENRRKSGRKEHIGKLALRTGRAGYAPDG